MEVEIVEEKENPFFKRIELKFIVKHPNAPTPSKEEIKKFLASKYNTSEEKVKIDYIMGRKGLQESIVKAKIEKHEA